jgi:hypothetical protein
VTREEVLFDREMGEFNDTCLYYQQG